MEMSELLGMFDPSLCRAARGLLGWSQAELAERAHISRSTVIDFERGARRPMRNNLTAMVRTLEEGGVTFILPSEEGGVGVRWSK